MLVKYIGPRPTYKDGLYGTGAWEKGQTKDVPADAAMKMFTHPDQYQPDCDVVGAEVEVVSTAGEKVKSALERVKIAFLDRVFAEGTLDQETVEGLGASLSAVIAAELGDVAEIEKVVSPEKVETEEDTQEIRDLVATMNKDALVVFAKTHFKTNLHPNIGEDNARAKVIGLIDQYGMS